MQSIPEMLILEVYEAITYISVPSRHKLHISSNVLCVRVQTGDLQQGKPLERLGIERDPHVCL